MLEFYTSLTVSASHIRHLSTMLRDVGQLEYAMSHVLTTPLYMSPLALETLRQMTREAGSFVCFDSAGYYVQVGRISYDELYYKLLQCYRANRWAGRYVLPDYVPRSQDSQAEVWAKVRQTVDMSITFYQEMPPELRPLAVPVVHGYDDEQIEYCLKHFLNMGPIAALGFGSFATTGKDNGSNTATQQSIRHVQRIVAAGRQHGVGTHLFGLGVPAMVGLISALGAASFDSASWMKSAGFGQVNLPLTRSYNMSYRSTRSELQKALPREEFIRLRELSAHQCRFCDDLDDLINSKSHRSLHNLLSVRQSVLMVNGDDKDVVERVYMNGSAKYRKDYFSWQTATANQLSA